MRKALALVALASLFATAAAATHILIITPGDSGVIQCPVGVLSLVNASAEQVEYICNDVPTATQTSTATPTVTETATNTPTATATIAPPPTATASATLAPTVTATGTPTATTTRTVTPTPTRTPTATPTRTATPTLTYLPLIMRFAVIGDSAQDEYRADDNRGAPYYTTTLNWVELLQSKRGLNFGAWGTRAEPRRSGYEYVWARSGATSAGSWTQLNGVVSQISAGQVTHVLIQVGNNDLNQNNLAYNIYNGTISGAAMTAALNTIADNIAGQARQANTAAPGRVLVASVQDFVTDLLLPEVAAVMPSAVGRQRLTDAYAYLNGRIAAQAAIDGVYYFDFNAALAAELAPRRAGNVITIGGQSITIARGNEYHAAWLNDQYAHAGTALSGLFANLYIDAINSAFGSSIPRMSDAEIITAAGG